MSDEGFLKRWSRRKREGTPAANEADSVQAPPQAPSSSLTPQAEEGSAAPPSLAPQPAAGAGDAPVGDRAREARDDDAVDPATLPPLESLGPESDYTVFLKKGVPEALRLAALRKAWASDPLIRDFRSPAIDYGWDFTTPDYALRPGDDVGKLLDRIFPPASEPTPAAPSALPSPSATADEPRAPAAAATPQSLPASARLSDAVPPAGSEAATAPAAEPRPPRRKHGGALPDGTV